MNWILKILFFFAGEYLKGQLIQRAKRKGVIAYLHALQGTRYAVMGVLGAFFVFHAILFAGFGALITGMMLLDLDTRTMLWVLFGIFSSVFFVPVLAIAIGLSERLWYKASGAEKMVDDLRGEREDSRAA